MGDVKVAVVSGTLNSANNGTRDFIKSGFGTPKACIVLVSLDITDNTVVQAESKLSIGFSDFANDYCIAHQDEDNQAKVDCDAIKSNTSCYTILDVGASVDGYGTASTTTDGVTLTNGASGGTGENPFATVIMFGGADLAVDLRSTATPNGVDSTTTIAHSGFTDGNDKLVFFIGTDISGEDSASSGINNSFGVCHATGSDAGGWTFVQRCIGWASDHNASEGAPRAILSTEHVLDIIKEDGTEDWAIEVTGLDHSPAQWTITERDASSGANMEIYSLALDLDDRKAKVGHISSPTSGATWTPSVSLGFTPQYVGLMLTDIEDIDTIKTLADAGPLGISSVSGSGEETCHSWYNEYNNVTTNTNNLFRSRAIDFRDHNVATVLQDHSFSSFNSGGWTYTINTENETVRSEYPYWAIEEAAADTVDDLLADDVESATEVTTPAIGQTHVITVTSVESASEVSAPVVGQEHALLADDAESASEVSTPVIVEVVPLLADDVESASEVTTPAIGQEHILAATSVESASETGTPVVGQEHVLLADDVQSTSEVSAPVIGQEHALTADDVQSASEVSAPVVAESNVLLADDVESASEVSAPAVGQGHALLADDAESASEVSGPAVGQEHALLADDAESASEVSAPAVGQTHALLADDVQSASEVSAPAVSESNILLADDVESTTEVSVPTVGQEHVLLADDVESTSEVGAPTIGQEHVFLADDVDATTEVSAPVIGQEHGLLSTSVESASEVSAPVLAESNVLLADDVESASEVSAPAVGQGHVLLADDVESASEVTSPTMAQIHALIADSIEISSELSAPVLVDLGGTDVLLADDVQATSEVSAPAVGQIHVLLADDVQSASEVSSPAIDAAALAETTRFAGMVANVGRLMTR